MNNNRKKTELKTTRLQRLIQKYESNQQFIQRVGEISQEQYFWLQIECGLNFLEQMYPQTGVFGSDFKEHYKKHAYSKAYWKWFRLEWKKYEDEFVQFLTLTTTKLTPSIWLEEMEVLAHDSNTEVSFTENYLKTLQYVL